MPDRFFSLVFLAVLALLCGHAAAVLRADQAGLLSSFRTAWNVTEWSGQPSCSWVGVECCTAGAEDCDSTFELVSAVFVGHFSVHRFPS